MSSWGIVIETAVFALEEFAAAIPFRGVQQSSYASICRHNAHKDSGLSQASASVVSAIIIMKAMINVISAYLNRGGSACIDSDAKFL